MVRVTHPRTSVLGNSVKYYKELLENRIADWTRYRKYLLAGLLGLLVADIAIVIVKQKWSVAGNEMEFWGPTGARVEMGSGYIDPG